MTSAVERRKQYADVLSLGLDALRRFPSFVALEGQWRSAIDDWRNQEEAADSSKVAEALAAKQAEEHRRNLRARRQSELLLADDILQQAHEELDNLLSSSSGVAPSSKPAGPPRSASEINALPNTSHTESLLNTSACPGDVDGFDERLPHLVPPSYFSKAERMLQQLGRSSESSSSATSVALQKAAGSNTCSSSSTSMHHRSTATHQAIRLLALPRDATSSVLHDLTELVDTLASHHWNPVLFHCRAACHYALGNFRLALKDSLKALELCHQGHHDSLRTLAFRRMLRCHVIMMDVPAALEVILQVKATNSKIVVDAVSTEQSLVAFLQHFSEACEHKLWAKGLDFATRLCSALPEAASLAEKRAELLVTLDSPGALDDAAAITLKFPSCGGVWYWYGVLQLRHSSSFQDVESASRSLQRAVSLAGIEGNIAAKQELQKVRYLESKSAMATAYYKSKRWRQAIAELTILLTLNGVSKGLKVYFTSLRAKAFLALGRPTECAADATFLLNHARTDDSIVEAYLLRAEAHVLGKNHDAAVRDVQCACGLLPAHQAAAAMLRRLNMEGGNDTYRPATPPPQRPFSSRGGPGRGGQTSPPEHTPSPPPRYQQSGSGGSQSARAPPPVPPHYAILGVMVSASSTAITKAYREAALKWHPDRWTSSTVGEKQKAEELFKKMNTAYQTLTDDALRIAYDREHGVHR